MITDKKIIQVIELDLPRCGLTYGQHPCSASIGVTGDFKCYNCPATCQDAPNYSATDPLTVRFSMPTAELELDLDAIPCIVSIQTRGQDLKPGESLGVRESISVSLQNFRHNDAGIDLYLADRGFNPYKVGTYFGKLAARWPDLQGVPLRHRVGELGDDLDDFETRHYFVESQDGPGSGGKFQVTAKDALKFLDGQKAMAPVASGGRLDSAINDTDTAITLTPSGVGDLEYGNAGYVSIGDEICSYTRDTGSDNMTLTARGLQGTEQVEHDADEVVQIVLAYIAVSPADISDDLIFSYTDTPATYGDLAAWQLEGEQFYNRLLTAFIPRPTPVRTLLNELIAQVGLLVYTDNVNQKIRWNVLRQKNPTVEYNDDNIEPGTFKWKADEEKRVDAVWTYYGQRNPLVNLDEDGNFKAISARYDDNEIKAIQNLPLSIKRINSRWIQTNNRPAADDIGDKTIQRYGSTPGRCSFVVPLTQQPQIGSRALINSAFFEDAQGNQAGDKIGIISNVVRQPDSYAVDCTVIDFRLESPADRVILIDENQYNLNLRDLHDLLYVTPGSGDLVTVIINNGVIIGDNTNGTSFIVGDWPPGVDIVITNNGRIQGSGGAPGAASLEGGEGGPPFILGFDGGPGSLAFYTRYPITLDNTNGEIWGGGGGGGADAPPAPGPTYFGGGGQGYAPGGGNATTEAPGTSATGASGGGPGQAGSSGSGSSGGAAGGAIDGDSYITYVAAGDIQGTQIN